MNRRKRMVKLAKKMLLEYFADGEVRQPTDFDEDFLGKLDVAGCVGLTKFAWNSTPFFKALGELVVEGKIRWWEDRTGHNYQIEESK